MALHFLNFYIGNLSVLSKEMDRNQRSIQLLNNKINSLTSDVRQKFQQFVGDMMKTPALHYNDDEVRDSQIKVIYFQIRQIQKFEAEKRALTREACNILDKYLTSLGRKVKSAQEIPVPDEDHSQVLAETLASIKLQLDQPVQGDALIIDMIKKMEDRTTTSEQRQHKPDGIDFDDVNKNVELFSTVDKCKRLTIDDMLGHETTSTTSDRPDSLQEFTETIIGICTEIKNRHGGEPSYSDPDASTVNTVSDNGETSPTDGETSSTDEDDLELCHCRTPEFGEMVACENSMCEIKWYHFECIGLHKAPEDDWMCPTCTIFGVQSKGKAKKDSTQNSSPNSPRNSPQNSPQKSPQKSPPNSPQKSPQNSP